jgi:hypothetical protein
MPSRWPPSPDGSTSGERTLHPRRPGRVRELPRSSTVAKSACHATTARAEDTDWARIVERYDELVVLMPPSTVRLNRAVAVAMAAGPRAGLEILRELTDTGAVANHPLLPAVQADLLRGLDRGGRRVPLWLPLGLGGAAVIGIWSYGRGRMLAHLVGGRILRELDPGQEVRLRFLPPQRRSVLVLDRRDTSSRLRARSVVAVMSGSRSARSWRVGLAGRRTWRRRSRGRCR